jgi:hypothetical protein
LGSDVNPSPAAVFAKIIRRDPDAVARVLAENVEALVGGKVNMELVARDGPDFATLFGDRDLYVFPIEDHHGTPFPSLLAFDLPAAVYSGGAFSLMGAEQIKEVLNSGEVPDILHDSIGEVANIICGAAVHMIRGKVAEAPQFRRGANFRKTHVGPWPSLLAEFGPRVPWEIVACRLSMGGEDRGTIFFSASDGEKGRVTRDEIIAVAGPDPNPPEAPVEEEDVALDGSTPPAADGEQSAPASDLEQYDESEEEKDEQEAPPARRPTPPSAAAPGQDNNVSGMRALVSGHPADPAAAALRSSLEAIGVHVLPAFTIPTEQASAPDALFVVSRSPVDLSIRLERVAVTRRPAIVIACSDRATRDLVVVSRNAGADDFLVLPAVPDRLRGLLSKVPVPA